MSARPGTTWWLLRHELRLFWYAALTAGSRTGARRSNWRVIGLALLLWLALHGGVLVLLRATGAASGAAPRQFVVVISAALLAAFLFMLSSALKASVDTLFDRGDMDLLLSSPLPSRSIFGVKLIGMILGVAAFYLFFLTPFAHVGLYVGQYRWLALYPLLLALAALAASMAMLLTLALVRLLGARRTRVVAQVLGALAGALLFLLSQAGTLMSREDGPAAAPAMARVMSAAAAIDVDSLAWLPARAALGDPGALLSVALTGLLAALLTVRLTHGFFVRGLQQAAGIGATPTRRRSVRYRFDRSLALVVVVKEWRLIARDPHLISQVLLQLLYLLPLCLIVFREGSQRLPATAAGLTMLCGSLAAALAWIILLAEDAPDLLQTAPASTATVRRAKLAAAIIPVLALVALPLLWLGWKAPVAGALTAITVCGAASSAALINLWTGRTTTRGEFKTRGKRNLVTSLLEVCSVLAWSGLTLLLLNAAAGAQVDRLFIAATGIAAVVALGLAPLAFLLRHRPR